MVTKALILAAIASEFNVRPEDWAVDMIQAVYPQKLTTPMLPSELPSIGMVNDPMDKERLISMIKDAESIDASADGRVYWEGEKQRTSVMINGKREHRDYGTRRAMYNRADGRLVFEVMNERYQDYYRMNWGVFSKNTVFMAKIKSAYAAYYGEEVFDASTPDAELIRFMATVVFVLVDKPITISEGSIDVVVLVTPIDNNTVRIDLDTKVDGVSVDPERIFNQVTPSHPVVGLPNTTTNKRVGAAFFQRQSEELTTDINQRDREHILHPKDVEILTSVSVQDNNGNWIPRVETNVVDLSAHMPTYDYFGLTL